MERKTPVGDASLKASRLGVLALAAAMAVGGMTASFAPAAEPTEQQKLEQRQKEEAAKRAKEEAAKAEQAKAEVEKAQKAKAEAERRQKEEADRAAAKQREEDQRAANMLNEAKQAYEQKNYGHSVNKYREFIGNFPKRPEVIGARFGLAMSLVEMPDRDWNALTNELQQVVATNPPDAGRANYWLAVALRIPAQQQLEAALNSNPVNKEQLGKALDRMGQSAAAYVAAVPALEASVNPKPAADAKELPPAMEMAARARVEGAEALLATGKSKEALDLVRVFVNDPIWAKSSQRPLGVVLAGKAMIEQKDLAGAFSALALAAPFDQIGIGLEARYLLGTVKEQTGERPEAILDYEAVIKGHVEQRRKAEESLRNRDAWRSRPMEQMRTESVVRTIPAYVSGAMFQSGILQFGYGQFGEAASKFQAFGQSAPRSENAPLAQLHFGMCQVMLKQAEPANRALAPLAEHPQLGDQATWWLGKLQVAVADPNNFDQRKKQVQGAIAAFAKAAEKAQAANNAVRKGDILLDQADANLSIRQFKEAAAIYEVLSKDASQADRAEVSHERLAQALHKAGDYSASDAACAAFLGKYPQSMLRPTVLFWQAHNTYQQGVELAKKPETAQQSVALQQKAAGQYQLIVDKYPEFSQASAARYGIAMSLYRQNKLEEAVAQFEKVAESDRSGDLAGTSYFQADCLIRTMPENADDALSAARLSSALEKTSALLASFVGSNPDLPETPEAMLRLADCYQRNAAILADQQERNRAFQSARETYDKLLQKYPKHPAFAQAVMDRARCMAAQGDIGGAINELNRFRNDGTLVKAEIAPLALIRLSEMMVRVGRQVDAVAMLDKARKDYEGELLKNPAKAGWVAGLRYQHGLALKESGKSKEALAIFEAVVKEYAGRPEAAEASLAIIQVRKDEAFQKLRQSRQNIANAPLDKPLDAKLIGAQDEAMKDVRQIAESFAQHADRIADKSAGSDLHIRTLRDAAASWRVVAETEIEGVRRARSSESLQKLKDKLVKDPPVGKSNSVPRPPHIKLAAIPLQEAEKKSREYYNKALEANPDSPICNELRLELAEMYIDRGEADGAIQLLGASIDKNPPPEVQTRLRVRLGQCYLLKKDANAAMQQSMIALQNAESPTRPAAYLVKGMAFMQQKNWGEAVGVLTRYRSGAEKYLNAGPVTEEGLMRLGECFAQAGSWEESRATFEHLIQRFGGSRWVAEARFGIGYALQQQKQFDRAVEAYADVTRRTSSDLAARAQLQIGMCRAEQKRWQDAVNELLTVPGTYDYAEYAASATLEAGKALVQLKEPAKAKEVLQRVVRDHPQTQWANEAAKQLQQIQ